MKCALFFISLMLLPVLSMPALTAEKIVIAHRGASGYLPEHTYEAKVMAYAQGADYLEQDVVMTKDNELVVLHDLYLERVTNVMEVFPGRQRNDGHYYVVDFNLAEIRTLQVTEGHFVSEEGRQAFYPQRFPVFNGRFEVHTFAEELELIQGLNHSTGKNVGIYPEIKSPWFFHQEGKDIAMAILEVLKKYGYDSKEDKVFLQSFDFNELKRVKTDLLPALDMDLKLVQLVAENSWEETFEINKEGTWHLYDYNWMHTKEGVAKLANYVDGIGPNIAMIVDESSTTNHLILSSLVETAHDYELAVHPYTFRLEEDKIPAYADSFENLLEIFFFKANVDGVFTDFPDKVVSFLQR